MSMAPLVVKTAFDGLVSATVPLELMAVHGMAQGETAGAGVGAALSGLFDIAPWPEPRYSALPLMLPVENLLVNQPWHLESSPLLVDMLPRVVVRGLVGWWCQCMWWLVD